MSVAEEIVHRWNRGENNGSSFRVFARRIDKGIQRTQHSPRLSVYTCSDKSSITAEGRTQDFKISVTDPQDLKDKIALENIFKDIRNSRI